MTQKILFVTTLFLASFAIADDLGDNGYNVEPYTMTVDLESPLVSGCSPVAIDRSSLIQRCGDDDGCRVSLLFSGSIRSVSENRMFVTDELGEEWAYDRPANTNITGNSTSGSRSSILATLDGASTVICILSSDAFSAGDGLFYLENCHDDISEGDSQGVASCTIRIDD